MNDQTLAYLAFAQYDDKELIRQVFRVGSSGIMSFEKLESHYQPTSWRYTIKPPTPQYECPGNLLFLVRRAKEDTRDIFNNGMPKRAMKEMPVWAFPNASDLAPRHLINAANNIKAKGLRLILCAKQSVETTCLHKLAMVSLAMKNSFDCLRKMQNVCILC